MSLPHLSSSISLTSWLVGWMWVSASRDYSHTEPVIAKLHHISFMFTKRIQQPYNLWLILDIQLCYMCSDPPERPLSISTHAAGGRLCLVPKCEVTILHRRTRLKIWEYWFKSQGLLRKGCFASVSSAVSCQLLYSRYENHRANIKNRLRIWCVSLFWDLSLPACAVQSPEIG